VVCEEAGERQDGRVDVHGIFQQLYAPGFPARQDVLTLALAIEWEPHERGQIDFSVDLLDPSSSPALTISGSTEVGDPEGMRGPPQTRLLMPLQGVVFPAAGTYVFELKVGEQRHRLAPLHLIHEPAG
jgi:hypothetical protein